MPPLVGSAVAKSDCVTVGVVTSASQIVIVMNGERMKPWKKSWKSSIALIKKRMTFTINTHENLHNNPQKKRKNPLCPRNNPLCGQEERTEKKGMPQVIETEGLTSPRPPPARNSLIMSDLQKLLGYQCRALVKKKEKKDICCTF
jgi:hypothetical protein